MSTWTTPLSDATAIFRSATKTKHYRPNQGLREPLFFRIPERDADGLSVFPSLLIARSTLTNVLAVGELDVGGVRSVSLPILLGNPLDVIPDALDHGVITNVPFYVETDPCAVKCARDCALLLLDATRLAWP